MNSLLLTSLLLFVNLWLQPNLSAGKRIPKVKCYKVYRSGSCKKRMSGRYTQKDCCETNGGASYQVIRRRGKKTKCLPCTSPTTPPTTAPIVQNWSAWGKWSKCNSVCGPGISRRTRQCLDLHGRGCPGSQSERKKCVHPTKPHCPIHGGWSRWTKWSTCSVTCGEGLQLRSRSCTNPKPQYGGRDCSGVREEKQKCSDTPNCPIHGGWGSWGKWSSCSVTCDIGLQTRVRKCDNPKPKYGGKDCDPLQGVQKQSCDTYKECDGEGSAGSGASGSGSSGDGSGSGNGSGSGEAEDGSAKGSGDDSDGDVKSTAKTDSDFDFDDASTVSTVKPAPTAPVALAVAAT